MKRLFQHEVMDQPDLDPKLHHQALNGLRRINWFSRSAGILWPSLRGLARQLAPQTLKVLDVATGAGDLPIRLDRLARQEKLAIQFAGCDVSPVAIAHANQQAQQQGAHIDFFVHDIFQQEPLPRYDVLMASLFLHHQPDEETARRLLARMAELTDHLVLVNDLARGQTHLVLAHTMCRILSRSPVVHTDGPRSVKAAFSLEEVRRLAEEAGLPGATVSWRWPFRFLLSWSKPRE